MSKVTRIIRVIGFFVTVYMTVALAFPTALSDDVFGCQAHSSATASASTIDCESHGPASTEHSPLDCQCLHHHGCSHTHVFLGRSHYYTGSPEDHTRFSTPYTFHLPSPFLERPYQPPKS